jgi:opacity protein-like surface antigen
MKKFALIAAALLAAGAAQAQTKPNSALYGEVGYVFLNADLGSGYKVDTGAVRGIIGWDLHQYVALEAMVAVGTSSEDLGGLLAGYKAKVSNSYGFYVKPKYALNDQVEVFGRLGFANSKVKLSYAGDSASDDDSSFSWGIGASYKINKQWYVTADYISYYDKDGSKFTGPSINAGFRF